MNVINCKRSKFYSKSILIYFAYIVMAIWILYPMLRGSTDRVSSSAAKQSPHAVRATAPTGCLSKQLKGVLFVWNGANKTLAHLKCIQRDCEVGDKESAVVLDPNCLKWKGLLLYDAEVLQDNCLNAVLSVIIMSMYFQHFTSTSYILKLLQGFSWQPAQFW